jgi:hypothetical protein
LFQIIPWQKVVGDTVRFRAPFTQYGGDAGRLVDGLKL